jgi:hypothetical protein
MKKQLQHLAIVASLALVSSNASAQTTADLENVTLASNSYWNGATTNPTVSTNGNFSSGNVIFPNTYNGAYGGYWESGWSYSNMKDSTTAGYTNEYSARTAVGYANSANYVVAMGGAKLKFNLTAQGKQMAGCYVTNGTFAALSMKNGDSFAKKFGGSTGSDPDWFKLKIQKYLGGVLSPNDSVVFYLADFRFANNTQDYIVNTWQYVNLTSLGNVDSLVFNLTSSDNGTYGMNTPNFFCLDNFTTTNALATGITEMMIDENSVSIYPNPASEELNVRTALPFTHSEIINQLGEVVISSNQNIIGLNELTSGIYFIKTYNDAHLLSTKKIIKN